ncbi:hypothetical protein WISP_150137 [Willisornis vidua]|uniref:Uncharacterized protein n=1 Tax=Willisornis vidua TaxID=1566151 RepID=A0ABQ9CJS7_9PASS|nr:hypothetical protein WISP_150137 [Willisornis vidua]
MLERARQQLQEEILRVQSQLLDERKRREHQEALVRRLQKRVVLLTKVVDKFAFSLTLNVLLCVPVWVPAGICALEDDEGVVQEVNLVLFLRQAEPSEGVEQEALEPQALHSQEWVGTYLVQRGPVLPFVSSSKVVAHGPEITVINLFQERDGMRAILESYDSELTPAEHSPQLGRRMREAEDMVQKLHAHNTELEAQLSQVLEEVGNHKQRAEMLEVEMTVLKSQQCMAEQSSVITKEEVDTLRLKIEELEAERSKLAEENRSLEMKLEKFTGQGDYDPSRTKVLHFSMNPTTLAKQQRKEEQQQLQEECERLRELVRVLEGGGSISASLEGVGSFQSPQEVAVCTEGIAFILKRHKGLGHLLHSNVRGILHPESFSAGLLPVPSTPKDISTPGIALTQLQHLALGIAEPPEDDMGLNHPSFPAGTLIRGDVKVLVCEFCCSHIGVVKQTDRVEMSNMGVGVYKNFHQSSTKYFFTELKSAKLKQFRRSEATGILLVCLQLLRELKKQVESAELKNQRLKEVFQTKIQEFRKVCYTLTGYQIDITTENQYRLSSIYAEHQGDCLLFKHVLKMEVSVEQILKMEMQPVKSPQG